MLEQRVIIIIDIGKTLAKVSVWSRDGCCLEKLTRPSQPASGGAYAALDTAATADWVITALAQFSHYAVEAIVPVAHGAALAAIRDHAPAFAPIDYEWSIPQDVLAAYRNQRDSFTVTGSPVLPDGLNLGSQLAFLDAMGALDGVTLLPYAQYWAWLLCDTAASEPTSLGCHSDLWVPAAADFSPMAKARGWAAQFAPLVRASDVIGTLRRDIAECTGLSRDVRVLAGLHDSNAALLAARTFPELSGKEATVLSTGTWFIAMRSPAGAVDLAALPEDRDCLVNVDALLRPVPSARFMGGREVEMLGERIDRAGTAGLAEALAAKAMVLPAQVPGCGPFPAASAGWVNQPGPGAARNAAVALYAALMADASLDLIGARERVLVEGRFASSELFVRALAALRPEDAIFTASDEADVSFGALTLAVPDLAPKATLARVEPLDCEMAAYRTIWRAEIGAATI